MALSGTCVILKETRGRLVMVSGRPGWSLALKWRVAPWKKIKRRRRERKGEGERRKDRREEEERKERRGREDVREGRETKHHATCVLLSRHVTTLYVLQCRSHLPF